MRNCWLLAIANDNKANQIHGFTIDYGEFILISDIPQFLLGNIRSRDVFRPTAREQKDLMDYKAEHRRSKTCF